MSLAKLLMVARTWKVDGRAQALVGPGLATPLDDSVACGKIVGFIKDA